MRPPRVFISYSRESREHDERVRLLADRLRADGVDAMIDQYAPPPDNWPMWMDAEIRKADFVLVVCTGVYRRRVEREEERGKGRGVLWEAKLVYNHLYDTDSDVQKLVPVLLRGGERSHIPAPLRGMTHFDLASDDTYEDTYEALYALLMGRRTVPAPPVGEPRQRTESVDREAAVQPVLSPRLGHPGFISAIALSPDGKTLVTGSTDRSVRVSDAGTGAAQRILYGHRAPVKAVAVSPRNDVAASASDDGTIYIWDLPSGHVVRVLDCGERTIYALQFSPDGGWIVAGGSSAKGEGGVVVLDAGGAGIVCTIQASGVYALAVSPGRRLIATADYTPGDGLILWDAGSQKRIAALKGHIGRIKAIAFPAEDRIVSLGDDGAMKLWDTADGTQVASVAVADPGVVHAAALSHDLRRMAISHRSSERRGLWGLGPNQLSIWDTSALQKVTPDVDPKTYAGLVATNGCLVGHADPEYLGVTDLSKGEACFLSRKQLGGIEGVAVSRDGRWFATAGLFSGVWHAQTGRQLYQPVPTAYHAAFTHDSSQFVICTYTDVERYDAALGVKLGSFVHDLSVRAMCMCRNGNDVALGSADVVKIVDVRSGRRRCAMTPGMNASTAALAASADGRWLAYGKDSDVKRWDAFALKEMPSLESTSEVRSVAVSADGRWIVAGDVSGTVRFWEAGLRLERRTFRQTDIVTAVALTSDGRQIVSGSFDGTLRVWDIATNREVRSLRGHTAEVTGVVLSPDGRWIISGSGDGSARIWDVVSGSLLVTAYGLSVSGYLTHSPDGYYVCAEKNDVLVEYRFEGRTVADDAFKAQFRRPDIIESRLSAV